jgi:DNA-binding PucR family transcriptional regulator
VAARLDVHENTIRYRLARIEQLTGHPVRTDSDVQLSMQLALLILHTRGRLSQLMPDPPELSVS